jgi:hypothetical protein
MPAAALALQYVYYLPQRQNHSRTRFTLHNLFNSPLQIHLNYSTTTPDFLSICQRVFCFRNYGKLHRRRADYDDSRIQRNATPQRAACLLFPGIYSSTNWWPAGRT